MFGVLVVVFCPDYVAALGFSLGERTDTAHSFFARCESPSVRGGAHSMTMQPRLLPAAEPPQQRSLVLAIEDKALQGNAHNFLELIGSVAVAVPADYTRYI
jgi:hypothetical protein